MTTPDHPTDHGTAAGLVRAFAATGGALADRADLARFLREHGLVPEGSIPITMADFEEAVALRDGIRAQLRRSKGHPADPDMIAKGQRVLDGLRVTVRIDPEENTSPTATATRVGDTGREGGSVLAPAVVDEVRRGLARIAAAWATAVATGEWRRIRA